MVILFAFHSLSRAPHTILLMISSLTLLASRAPLPYVLPAVIFILFPFHMLFLVPVSAARTSAH